MAKRKNLAYYMSLPYKVQIVPLPFYEDGGYMACIPQLSSAAFVGDGDTEEEALASLEKCKKIVFEIYLEDGLRIPEPGQPWDVEYNNKILAKLDKKKKPKAKAKAK